MEILTMQERGRLAREASLVLSAADFELRNAALASISVALDTHREELIIANLKDRERSQAENLAEPLMKRLTFDDHKIDDVIQGLHDLMTLPDPLNHTQMATALDDGLELYRVSCPIGVIGIVFESRPDAFVQISSLCLKSGNAVLLKGGREAAETNRVLHRIIAEATVAVGLPEYWIQNLETRNEVTEMLALDDYIDLIIPRGSNAFVKYIMQHSNIPVMGHADGICHVYIDEAADLDMAIRLAVDSKAQYTAVCNAAETLLVHRDIAEKVLPPLAQAMREAGVRLLGDERVRQIIDSEAATEADWSTEYLDYVLSIKIVNDVQEAIDHINRYGSGHTDVIVTENKDNARQFTTLVDSACVFVNCSSRFSDGFRFGFGAEVGISTSKLHARGPVGLEGLISYKYKCIGHGQIVADYASGEKQFKHTPLHKGFNL